MLKNTIDEILKKYQSKTFFSVWGEDKGGGL